MTGMLKRNLYIYFRDRSAVFFSLFGALMIVALYALFLGDVNADSFVCNGDSRFLMNSWVMAALTAASSVTTGMGAFGVMVNDAANRTDRDFQVSPVLRSEIISSYMLGSVVISTAMTLCSFLFSELYIVLCGGRLLHPIQIVQVLGVIAANVLSSCAIIGFLCTFLHSSQAFTGISIAVGASIGFFVGAYLPMGQLPPAVQKVLAFLPCSHASALLRQIMTDSAIASELADWSPEALLTLREELGIVLRLGDSICTPVIHLAFLFGSAVLFFLLSVLHITFSGRRYQ